MRRNHSDVLHAFIENENAGAKNIFEHGKILQKVVKIFYLLWDPEIDLKDNQDEGSRSNSDQA